MISGRARTALWATAATLMAACAILPLIDGTIWLLEAMLLLSVQTGVGALTRRVPLPRPLTVVAQALVTLAMLTLSFDHRNAFAVVVPTPGTFRLFGELLQQGANDVQRYATPAPLSDGIQLMVVGGVLLIGLVVDALAVTFRNAATAGLPLLALYSIAAGLSDGGASWLAFLVAAAGYLMLLLSEGRERLSQWGRVFGRGSRPENGRSGPVAPARTGRRIGAAALGLALLVPLVLPTLGGGLVDAVGNATDTGIGGGGKVSAVNPLLSLRDDLNDRSDRTVLSMRSQGKNTQGLYLRIVSLDEFDGTVWKPAQRRITDVPDRLPTPPGLGSDVQVEQVRTRIAAADWYAQNYLPMPYPPSGVDIDGDWRYEPLGMALVGDRGQNTRGVHYEVTSLEVRPTAEQLAAAPEPDPTLVREYTRLPESLPDVVARTARQVTKDAGNHYEQAVQLEDWFRSSGGFVYNTQVQGGSGAGAITRFLKDKQGFCVHFSFAMASMARSLGIPARVAVGFAPGTPQGDGSVAVGLRDAHAWPELYFEGVGWTRFEPTPSRGYQPDYTLPRTPETSPTSSAQPSEDLAPKRPAVPSASSSCSVADKRLGSCDDAVPQAAPPTGGGGPPWQLLGWTALALLLATVLLLPMVWRLRVRAVRLGALGRAVADTATVARVTPEGHTGTGASPDPSPRGPGTAQPSLRLWQELSDTAWDLGIQPDHSLTPRRSAARIVRLGRLEPAPAEAVHRVASAVEQVLYSPRPRPVPGLAGDVREATAALRAGVSRATRLRALLVPRSTIRAVWAASSRWKAAKRRFATAVQRLAVRRPAVRRPYGKPGDQES